MVSKVKRNRSRGGLVNTASIIIKRDSSTRHLRRKAERLAEKRNDK